MSLPVGTVLWREPKTVAASGVAQNTRPVLPADSTSDHSVFAGIVCRDGEPETGVITVATGGNALALVLGPATKGDTVYRVIGYGYTSTTEDIPVGHVQEDVAIGVVKLCRIIINSAVNTDDLPVWL